VSSFDADSFFADSSSSEDDLRSDDDDDDDDDTDDSGSGDGLWSKSNAKDRSDCLSPPPPPPTAAAGTLSASSSSSAKTAAAAAATTTTTTAKRGATHVAASHADSLDDEIEAAVRAHEHETAAATRIQATFRGHRTRAELGHQRSQHKRGRGGHAQAPPHGSIQQQVGAVESGRASGGVVPRVGAVAVDHRGGRAAIGRSGGGGGSSSGSSSGVGGAGALDDEIEAAVAAHEHETAAATRIQATFRGHQSRQSHNVAPHSAGSRSGAGKGMTSASILSTTRDAEGYHKTADTPRAGPAVVSRAGGGPSNTSNTSNTLESLLNTVASPLPSVRPTEKDSAGAHDRSGLISLTFSREGKKVQPLGLVLTTSKATGDDVVVRKCAKKGLGASCYAPAVSLHHTALSLLCPRTSMQ
jgi:hypothetical protein